MPNIGYDTVLDLTALQDAIVAAVEDENPAAAAQAVRQALQDAKAKNQAALETTKKATEDKALQPGHPWYGKTIKFAPLPVRQAYKLDNKIVVSSLWDYQVAGPP